jgi:hypothetical protein
MDGTYLLQAAAMVASVAFLALAFRIHWLARYNAPPPKIGNGWVRAVFWSALAGCIYSYYDNKILLCGALAFLSGSALMLDIIALRDSMRRNSGTSLRRVK